MIIIVSSQAKSSEKLSRAAKIVGYQSFEADHSWKMPDNIKQALGAVYGGDLFCESIADQMGWSLISNPADWVVKLPKDYTARNIFASTIEGALKHKEKKFFIKSPTKLFKARVCEAPVTFPTNVLNDHPILISDYVNFTSEYKCFVKNKKVVSICCYKWTNEFNTPANYGKNNKEVITFVNKMLADARVECVSATVINVGKHGKLDDNGNGLAVIDSEPAYMSEIYGCEISASLDTIMSSCGVKNN